MLSLAQKPAQFFGDIKRQTGRAACRTSFYNWLLSKGTPPNHIQIKLTDPWPGNADIGRMMCHNVLLQHGMSIKMDAQFWNNVAQHDTWAEIVHRFTWLRDLRAAGGDTARKLARDLVGDWLDTYDRWDATLWRPDIMGQRISMWISFYDFFCGSADETFQKKYFASLHRQARHLSRSIDPNLSEIPLLEAAKGLIYAGIALADTDNWTLQGFEIALREIPKQIDKDGCHISGSPENILKTARILLDLRYALKRADLPVPKAIEDGLKRMGSALRFFSYPDHKLALFHGGQEGDSQLIDTTLSQIRDTKRPSKITSAGGFERVMIGRAVLMIDTSSIPPSPYDTTTHSAPLAFEFAYGRDRIFTNCGGHPFNEDWQQGLRHTAAHNALVFDGKPIHTLDSNGHITRPHGPICSVRRETKDACLIDVSHDALRGTHGIDHKRRFYLSQQGHDFRGEDTLLARVPLSKPAPVAIRFHLHPRVQISSIEDNGDVVFTLPAGSTWRFCAVGATPTLESSIFLGNGVKPIQSRQIVLNATLSGDSLLIKWGLQRI